MKIVNAFLIGIITLFTMMSLITIPNNINYAINSDLKQNTGNPENDNGCCSVILDVKTGHDIVSYRRDSNYSADMIIDNTTFAGQNAVKQYKTQKGYFTHIIITGNGWIIGMGGRDNPTTTKMLEKLGSNIISKNKIEKTDMDKANALIKSNGWGHFIIKSPEDDVGVTAYDSRVSTTMTELLKMKEGDYIKIPNNARYYSYSQYKTISTNPVDAAIKIAGTDVYGKARKDIITYDYINENSSKKVDVWASFDGGAMITSAKEAPDDIQF
ncbi:MAG: hypothetical protein ACXVHY_07730, partial [Methanobacterium sp.]